MGAGRWAGVVVVMVVVVVEARLEPRAAELLRTEGLQVETTSDSSELVEKVVDLTHPQLVLLEVSSVSPQVVKLCLSLRAHTDASIVVFCEGQLERDVVAAFLAGAHSVFSEPIGPHELVARVRALLRRAAVTVDPRDDTTTIGPIVLDRATRRITVDGEYLPMPRREFDIAELLMSKAGLVVTRAELVRELWGTARDTKSLDVQVGRLRAKLFAAEGVQRILTIRGVGYRFANTDEVQRASEAQRRSDTRAETAGA
jgi:two-component system response regulator RegX3